SRGCEKRIESTECVDDTKVGRGIQQRLVLVLSVQLDQAVGQFLERAGCGERTVHKRATSPLCGDLPPDEEVLASALEDRFYRRCVLACANEIAGGATTEQQPDSLDENRLSRTGFACQDVQAGVEFHLDRIDDRQMSNAQKAEHGETTGTPMV